MHLSKFYALSRTQASLDFVDVDSSTDVSVFIDPRAIRLQRGDLADQCSAFLTTFFTEVLEATGSDDATRLRELLGRLGEPNETHLGLSRGNSKGRGLGKAGIRRVTRALLKSKAIRSGLLQDLEDSALLVPGIGPDIVSDMATHILRGVLIGYTQRACNHYGIPMEQQHSGPIWHPDSLDWSETFVDLPRTPEGKLLLVPKSIVRHSTIFNKDRYFNGYLAPRLEADELDSGSELVKLLKNGERKVNRKDLKNKYGSSKDAIVDLTLKFEGAPLNEYRTKAGSATSPPLDNDELAEATDNPEAKNVDLLGMLAQVQAIKRGVAEASLFHQTVESLLSAVLYPALANVQLEQEIHEGRKRLDIFYDNVATTGFFEWLNRNYRCPTIVVECKNYVGDPANPELDQLAGRFSPSRGWVGLLVCRDFKNKAHFIRRCRDTALDNRGYIIALDDEDLRTMVVETLNARGDIREHQLSFDHLRERFQQLIG